MQQFHARWYVAIALVATSLGQGTCAFAGTTGALNGTVVSTSGAPVANARVVATSPSQSATATTDSHGRFSFISLAPDTYTVQAEKDGFTPSALAGITVFADQVLGLHFALGPTLKTIARVTTRSSMDLVKPGTTTDVYSVNASVVDAARGLGGGGSLNSLYSAITTVPGVYVPPGQVGTEQALYIRGGRFGQVGFEYDGVPVNRSFDNYPASTGGTIGTQEVQVYAGGGSADENASGLTGFINQVIKTGTFPGYANATLALGTPSYYHNLALEVGGASPDRLFSYYAGFSGYDQTYRFLNQFNGADMADVWGNVAPFYNLINGYSVQGVFPHCIDPTYGAAAVTDPFYPTPGQSGSLPIPVDIGNVNTWGVKNRANDPGCYTTISPTFSNPSNVSDREAIFNVHAGIPHRHDGGKDDVQVLYNITAMLQQYYGSPNDIGPNLFERLTEQSNAKTAYYNATYPPQFAQPLQPVTPALWSDVVTWPSGTYFGQPAANLGAVAYFDPGSTAGRCANVAPTNISDLLGKGPGVNVNVPQACSPGRYSAIPFGLRPGGYDDASIVKIQYQHNIGSSAYLRLYGYTFYSDELLGAALGSSTTTYGFQYYPYNYVQSSHTRGAVLEFADQIDAKNLLDFSANYTTATIDRFNNITWNNSLDTDATSLTNGKECFAYVAGTVGNVSYAPGQVAPCNSNLTSGTYADPTRSIFCAQEALQPKEPQCASTSPRGASWLVTTTGERGLLNQVTPVFISGGFEDRWQPTDKIDVNVGARYTSYAFDLANTSNNGQNFWFAAADREYCYNPVTGQGVYIFPPPFTLLPPTPFIGFNCPVDRSSGKPVQTVHPDGKNGHLFLSNDYPSTYSVPAFSPRAGMTYTIDNDTVLRASAGRYVQQPGAYGVQFNSKASNLASLLYQQFWSFGYATPFHPVLPEYADNYDLSYERRFKGTDMSVKLTPYYDHSINQLLFVYLPYNGSGELNTGVEDAKGVEFQFSKGDFSRNGLSLLLSYTYLNARERFDDFPGTSVSPLDQYNQALTEFNALTKAGGGAQCYVNNGYLTYVGTYRADPTCAPVKNFNRPVWNPYYSMPAAPLLDRNGWYPVGLNSPYLSPNTLTLVLNYRHGRFAITPALSFNQGEPYGTPQDASGIDPRTCLANSRGFINSPISRTNPLQADYTSCIGSATPTNTLYIPNPETGHFDRFGEFEQPSQLNASLTLSYDVNPRIKLSIVMTNLVNACFGGSKTAWSTAFPPNAYTCGYVPNLQYVSNFYNGVSPNDRGANGVPINPALAHSYNPSYADPNSYSLPGPFNAIVQANIRL